MGTKNGTRKKLSPQPGLYTNDCPHIPQILTCGAHSAPYATEALESALQAQFFLFGIEHRPKSKSATS